MCDIVLIGVISQKAVRVSLWGFIYLLNCAIWQRPVWGGGVIFETKIFVKKLFDTDICNQNICSIVPAFDRGLYEADE